MPIIYSLDETVDVGRDTASPVSDDYAAADSVFTGDDRMGPDRRRRHHRGVDPVPPEDRLRVALARQ